MEITDKYTTQAASTIPGNEKKLILSNDAYAITEAVNELSKVIRRHKIS